MRDQLVQTANQYCQLLAGLTEYSYTGLILWKIFIIYSAKFLNDNFVGDILC